MPFPSHSRPPLHPFPGPRPPALPLSVRPFLHNLPILASQHLPESPHPPLSPHPYFQPSQPPLLPLPVSPRLATASFGSRVQLALLRRPRTYPPPSHNYTVTPPHLTAAIVILAVGLILEVLQSSGRSTISSCSYCAEDHVVHTFLISRSLCTHRMILNRTQAS